MIINEIRKHLNNSDAENNENVELLKSIEIRLSKAKLFIIGLGPGVVLTYGTFIFSPFLVMNSTYSWPILSTGVYPIYYAFIHSLKDNKNSDSSDSRITSNKDRIINLVIKENEKITTTPTEVSIPRSLDPQSSPK